MPEQEAERVRKIFREKLINKEPFYNLGNVNRHKDGRLVILETNGIPIFDAQGQLEGYMGIDRDITARKQAEEALRKSEERYRLLAETATDIILTTDMNMHLTYVNPAVTRVLGWTVEEVMARTMKDAYTSASFEVAMRILAEEMAVEKTGQGDPHRSRMLELELFHKDGTAIPVEAHVSFFRDSTGKPVGVLSIARDITERKQAEESLQMKNDELTNFIHSVSHDLKSPLVTVKTFLGYLEQDIRNSDTSRMEKDLEYIRNAADKMSLLLDELLELFRIGRIINLPEEVSLQAIVQEASLLVAGRIVQQIVHIQVTEKTTLLYGDRIRLVEVFQNLIDNAVKFMGNQPKPCIEIGAEQDGGKTVFFVRDNGIGIDPRHQSKLFNLFEKLDPNFEGTGIGLVLVKRIVELHGGKIWVESEGLGKGATFRFTLAKNKQVKT